MTFEEAIKEVESHQFSARTSVASNFRTFLRAAQQHMAIHVLYRALDSPGRPEQILSRIADLSKLRTDPRYENPWDVALTVHLLLLGSKAPDLTRVAAELVAGIPQCWWAAKLARHFLLESDVRSIASVSVEEAMTLPPGQAFLVKTITNAADWILPGVFPGESGRVPSCLGLRRRFRIEAGEVRQVGKWLHKATGYEVGARNPESTTVVS